MNLDKIIGKSYWDNAAIEDKLIPTGSDKLPEKCCSCLKDRSICKSLVSIGNPKEPLPYYVCEECITLMYELIWK